MLRLPPIKLESPSSIEAAAELAAQDDTRIVAGGTDLWPNMKRRHQKATTVVSLMSVPGLDSIDAAKGDLEIGATCTLTHLIRDEDVRRRFPGLATAAAAVSSPPLRNMGTIGGNLCVDTRCTYYNQTEEWRRSIDYCLKEDGDICWVATKSPRCWAHSASDTAPMLCALGASVTLATSDGERQIPLADLYVDDGIDYLTIKRGEIITSISVPATSDAKHCRTAFWKLRRRGSIDFSVLSVAAAVWMDKDENVERAEVWLGAVGGAPLPVDATSVLQGKQIEEEAIAEISHAAHKVARPMDNTDHAPSWRGKMSEQYVTAALREVAGLPQQRMRPRHMLMVV